MAPTSLGDKNSRHRFKKTQRLRNSFDFKRVFDHRLSVADGTLIVYGRPIAKGELGRIGLSVSRKVGNAVVRNRWKRFIRESYRAIDLEKQRWELVVIPCRGGNCSFDAIRKSLPNAIRRLNKKRQHRESSPRSGSRGRNSRGE